MYASIRTSPFQTILLCGALLFCGCHADEDSGTADSIARINNTPSLTGAIEEPQRGLDDWDQRIAKANQQVAEGDFENARSMVRHLLVESPQDVSANLLMSELLVHQGNLLEAVAILDQVASENPLKSEELEQHAVEVLLNAGRISLAIARWELMIQRHPQNTTSRRRLAQRLNSRGHSFDANEHFRKLLREHPLERDELVSLIFPARAWVSTKQIDRLTSDDERKQLGIMNIATALRIEGRARDAVEIMQGSDGGNRHPAADALFGRSLASCQMHDRLGLWLKTADPQCERYPDYWIAAGVFASQQREPLIAVDCFLFAIDREPQSMDAHYGLVEALEASQQNELAESFRRRIGTLDAINRLVKKIRDAKSPSAESYVEVAQGLQSVGRPLEAIGWQELALSRFAPRSPQRSKITQYKKQILQQLPNGRDSSIVQCDYQFPDRKIAKQWLFNLRKKPSGTNLVNKAAANNARLSAETMIDSAATVPVFENVAAQVGLRFRYQNAPVPVEREFLIFQAFGGGLACLDFDRNGQVDFYCAQAAANPPNEIANKGNALFQHQRGKFTNVVNESQSDDRHYSVGVTSGDWNQDGFVDLVIGNLGANTLLINQGDGTFVSNHNTALSDGKRYTSSLAIADVTGDALPEIIEVNYVDDDTIFDPIEYGRDGKPLSLPGPLQFHPAEDRILVSVGDGTMKAEPLGGHAAQASTGLALLVTDLDGELGNEVFVANDLRANQLWTTVDTQHADSSNPIQSRTQTTNLQNHYMDVAISSGVAYGGLGKPMACMGIAAADFDGNGRLDLHVTNFENEWSNQYMQKDQGVFVDLAAAFRIDSVSQTMLGFGVQAVDYDNDTQIDLLVGNGHIEDLTDKGSLFAMPTQLLARRADGYDQQQVSGDEVYWDAKHFSRAMARCDFNQDGRTDVAITDLKTDLVLLENQTETSNHWLQLELVGTVSERDAIGAHVWLDVGDKSYLQSVQTGDGYLSKNEPVLSWGLGPTSMVDRIRVRWPSGIEQTWEEVDLNHRWMLVESQESAWKVAH